MNEKFTISTEKTPAGDPVSTDAVHATANGTSKPNYCV